MQRLCKRLGFHLTQRPGDDVVKATLDLRGADLGGTLPLA